MNEAMPAMEKAVGFFADQLIGIRSGAVSPGVIDTVRVEYYGSTVPISHVAATASDQSRVIVRPHDPRRLGAVEKALKQAGFSAHLLSKTQVVVPFSALSGEQRARVIDHVNRLAEEAKVAVRNVRRKYRQNLAKEDRRESEGVLQGMTDEAIGRIEELGESKLHSM
jgi:ribosome recycling factor